MTIHSSGSNRHNTDEIYDFIFIGLGASNSLILLALINNGSIANKKVAVLEMASKNANDKTYCFWASPNELIVRDLSPIITNYYNTIKINDSVYQSIEEQPYYYIRSIDLYNYTLETSNLNKINIYREAVDKVSCDNGIYSVHTTTNIYQALYVFDSRPPSPYQLGVNDIYLDQSFYGLHVKCEEDVFQERSFEMMNFNVEQSGYTQFVYILPFSSKEALIEITRFGSQKIDLSYAKAILDKLILNDFGNYEILADEIGCIPMTTFVNNPNQFNGILHTGAGANLIKASTGYGFKNMFAFAQKVASRIAEGNYEQFNRISLNSKKRFKFYDRLLLTLLLYWPYEGKKIFTRLFERQSVMTIFSFLDEKTTLYQEVKIFASLPMIPFLKSLYLIMKGKKYLHYVVAFLAAIAYLIIESYNIDLANKTSYLILIVGFLALGIPHGALDHLLIKVKGEPLYEFVLKYLLVVLIYFALWQYFPLFSLIIFVLFSSFHFGESELEQIGVKVSSISAYLKAFFLGSAILLFIISTHYEESINIIVKTNAIKLQYEDFNNISIYFYGLASISLLYILSQSIISKIYSYYGLIFLLLIGIKLPLVLAFGLYFIFQHSYNAWSHLQIGLKKNSVSLYKKALPFTVGALLLLMTFVIIDSKNIISTDGFWAIFFVFIACISLPHFVLMHLFYRPKDD